MKKLLGTLGCLGALLIPFVALVLLMWLGAGRLPHQFDLMQWVIFGVVYLMCLCVLAGTLSGGRPPF